MTTTCSSMLLCILCRSPRRPPEISPIPSRISLARVDPPRDILPSPGVGVPVVGGTFEMSITLLQEAAALATRVPYLGVFAGILLDIARIKAEVDLYRDLWEEVMYNIVKVANLVGQLSASCQQYGLGNEVVPLPQNLVGIMTELEIELGRVVRVMSQCRGKTRCERLKMGIARNDMIKQIQKCDRQMSRMFERFVVAMLFDIRFQLVAGGAQSTPTTMPIVMELSNGVQESVVRDSYALVSPRSYMSESVRLTNRCPYTDNPVLLENSRPTSANSGSTLLFTGPIRPQIFFGRDHELKTIIDLISSSSFAARIAILGPGGVGKTALALAVLTHEEAVSRFGDSRYLVPCKSLMSRDAMLVAIANSLSLFQHGLTFDTSSVVGLESHVLSALRSEECILCLDNFESSRDQLSPSRRAIEMLLADITALPSVTVLITTRGEERPKGTAWTLPMLPPLTNLPHDAAKRTWESLAGTCDEWAEKLIETVDCLPLAVTLLGSLAEVSTAEALWDHWQKESVAFVEKEKGDKLASLEFSIALSLESGRMAADVSSKRLLGILSMLPNGMPADPSLEFRRLFSDIPDISRSLVTLLKCSLAVRAEDNRVRVNSLVQLYCESHDLASPEDRRALRDYYVTLASHGRKYNNPSRNLLKRMTTELNNMGTVLCKSLAWTPLPEVTPVIEAIIAYTQFCTYIGNFSEVVVTCAPEVQGLLDKTLGDFLTSLGSVSLCGGKVALAEVHFKRALVLHESAQDIIGQAYDYCRLGDVLYRCHRMEEAMTCYQRALDLNVQSNNSAGQVDALTRLAEIYKKLGRLEESREHYERSLPFYEEHHNQRSLANTLNDLGHFYLMMDNIKRANESFKGALELHKAVNNPVGQAKDISGLADVYQRLYKLARAEAAHKKVDGSARPR